MPAHESHALVTRRLIAAPRERVWAALRDPAGLARCWGPAGFTNTFHEFQFQPGGTWRFTMHGPDGAAYLMDHRFAEIVAPARLVVRHLQPGHDFTLTITLAARGAATEVGWHQLFDDPAEAARVRAFVLPANEQNLDRLAAEVSGTAASAR